MKRGISIYLILVVFIFFAACGKKPSAPKAAPTKPAQTAPSQVETSKGKEDEVYIYDKKGKRDPFVSLVASITEKPQPGPTPLENYDIGAIKVIAIVWGQRGYFAEIVLPDGKAYTVKEGMTVGLHKGKIQKITKNSIVFKEFIKDYRGEIKSKETILKLREEGEE